MSFPANYITIDRTTSSRSGLYATDLPGVEIAALEAIVPQDWSDEGYEEFFNTVICGRAWTNLITDVSTALQNKFYVDAKIVSRETSKFQESYNSETGLAGIRIRFDLPKYARIHVLDVRVFSESEQDSPEATIQFFEEDGDGELLYEVSSTLSEGKNTINVDRDFEVCDLFIAYDPEQLSFKKTENKYFPTDWIHWDELLCTFSCANGLYQGTIQQINGGGLNVKYNIICSIEKFVLENLNLFKTALWYRIGVEIMDELLLGHNISKYSTMTEENATERSGYFGSKYSTNMTEAIKSQNVREDPVCFICKNTVSSKSNLP